MQASSIDDVNSFAQIGSGFFFHAMRTARHGQMKAQSVNPQWAKKNGTHDST